MLNSAGIDYQALSNRFLDAHRKTQSMETLDVVAHMLLRVEDRKRAAEVGVHYLARKLSAGRVDIGFGSPSSRVYKSDAECVDAGAPSMLGQEVSNRLPLYQRVWRSQEAVVCENVDTDLSVAPVREQLKACSIKSLMARPLRSDGEGAFAIVCVDELESSRVWEDSEVEQFTRFCSTFFAPILAISHQQHTTTDSVKPSPAELDAIRLASQGLSYKRIAGALGKSVRTIEFQLRNARQKTGASNQVELVSLCRRWL